MYGSTRLGVCLVFHHGAFFLAKMEDVCSVDKAFSGLFQALMDDGIVSGRISSVGMRWACREEDFDL